MRGCGEQWLNKLNNNKLCINNLNCLIVDLLEIGLLQSTFFEGPSLNLVVQFITMEDKRGVVLTVKITAMFSLWYANCNKPRFYP